jgi:hypothetical protein
VGGGGTRLVAPAVKSCGVRTAAGSSTPDSPLQRDLKEQAPHLALALLAVMIGAAKNPQLGRRRLWNKSFPLKRAAMY